MDSEQPQQPAQQPQQTLYGTAARNAAGPQPRPLDPELVKLHEASATKYPRLGMSKEEYVIEEVHRHPIGMVSIWLLTGVLIFGLFAVLALYGANTGNLTSFLTTGSTTGLTLPSAASLFPFVAVLSLLIAGGGVIATMVYEGNEFFITNEAIFQNVRTSLFNTQTQVVSLINVEDVSQDKAGVMQQLLNYGTLRVSTQGQETTYHFYFVANPERVVNLINDAAEKAVLKMQGVPVSEH